MNAFDPITLTEAGIVMWTNDRHRSNAIFPILSSPSFSSTLSIASQRKNAPSAITLTVESTLTRVMFFRNTARKMPSVDENGCRIVGHDGSFP